MHPAYSVIFFTVASGAGYGLLILLSMLMATDRMPVNTWFAGTAFTVALAAVTLGLLSSTYHLGKPMRTWRALSQWRSSWLSREGVLALVTYLPALALALHTVKVLDLGRALGPLAVITAVVATATVFSTAKIYQSLKTIQQWNNQWTVINYLVLALASGAVLLHALTEIFSTVIQSVPIYTVLMLFVASYTKRRYWQFIDNTNHPSTPENATGLGQIGKVRLFQGPHAADNYLMKEMGYSVARQHAEKLRVLALALGFAIPVVAVIASSLLSGDVSKVLACIAIVPLAIGFVIKRWLFFAEARHVVTLFYGRENA
jgi:sulfite dehydrogenase (quinone) subunit SoeC